MATVGERPPIVLRAELRCHVPFATARENFAISEPICQSFINIVNNIKRFEKTLGKERMKRAGITNLRWPKRHCYLCLRFPGLVIFPLHQTKLQSDEKGQAQQYGTKVKWELTMSIF